MNKLDAYQNVYTLRHSSERVYSVFADSDDESKPKSSKSQQPSAPATAASSGVGMGMPMMHMPPGMPPVMGMPMGPMGHMMPMGM